MKRRISILLAMSAVLLCLLSTCKRPKPPPSVTTTAPTRLFDWLTTTEPLTEPITEPQTEAPTEPSEEEPWVEPPPVPEGYAFTEFYAKTPTHFYILGYRGSSRNSMTCIALNDIHEYDDTPLPETYEDHKLQFSAICGVAPKGIYVYGYSYEGEYPDRVNYGDVIYRIPFNGGEAELMETGGEENRIISAWYNAASNSLLMYREIEGFTQIEAIRLDTDSHAVICHLPVTGIYEDECWHNTEKGVVFCMETIPGGGGARLGIVIDERNRVEDSILTVEELEQLYGYRKRPTNDAETALLENGSFRCFATCNGWLYYMEDEHGGIEAYGDLYRMRLDGSKKTLLQKGTRMDSLEAMNGKLFALCRYEIVKDRGKAFNDVYLYELDSYGKIVRALGMYGDGYDSHMFMQRMDNLILLYHDNYRYYSFTALFDPATGKMFTG